MLSGLFAPARAVAGTATTTWVSTTLISIAVSATLLAGSRALWLAVADRLDPTAAWLALTLIYAFIGTALAVLRWRKQQLEQAKAALPMPQQQAQLPALMTLGLSLACEHIRKNPSRALIGAMVLGVALGLRPRLAVAATGLIRRLL